MANLNVTYADMQDSANRMRRDKTDIDNMLNECKAIVDNLTSSGFVTDQASGRFEQVHTDFVTSATKVMEDLEQLSMWLDKAVAAMQDMDSQLTGSLNS